MIIETLALVIRVEDEGMNDGQKCEAVWSKAAETLLPQMGTWYDRFQPSGVAWCKLVRHPFGVVLGSDQTAFKQFYALAKLAQERSVRNNLSILEKLADSAKRFGSFQDGHISVYGFEASKGLELIKHMSWQDDITEGKLVPGAALHYCAAGDKQFDRQTDARVLGSPEKYALCLVDIITSKE